MLRAQYHTASELKQNWSTLLERQTQFCWTEVDQVHQVLDQDSGGSDSLDVLSQLFDQFDVDISLQQSRTHLLQHSIQHLEHTDR